MAKMKTLSKQLLILHRVKIFFKGPSSSACNQNVPHSLKAIGDQLFKISSGTDTVPCCHDLKQAISNDSLTIQALSPCSTMYTHWTKFLSTVRLQTEYAVSDREAVTQIEYVQ